MRANGCLAPDFARSTGLCKMSSAGHDPHRFYVAYSLDEYAVGAAIIDGAPLMQLQGADENRFSAWRSAMARFNHQVKVDVHWDNYLHGPTSQTMNVCAWCFLQFEKESNAQLLEEHWTDVYYDTEGRIPSSCLSRYRK